MKYLEMVFPRPNSIVSPATSISSVFKWSDVAKCDLEGGLGPDLKHLDGVNDVTNAMKCTGMAVIFPFNESPTHTCWTGGWTSGKRASSAMEVCKRNNCAPYRYCSDRARFRVLFDAVEGQTIP